MKKNEHEELEFARKTRGNCKLISILRDDRLPQAKVGIKSDQIH